MSFLRSFRVAWSKKGLRWRTLIILIFTMALPVMAAAPSWWLRQGLIDPNAAPDDTAILNQGQLKAFAVAAMKELDAEGPGGAGMNVHKLVNTWLQDWANANSSNPQPGFGVPDDYAPVNLGQLKYVAAQFYDQLITQGYAQAYPWVTNPAGSPDDTALANIGQAKFLFSFDVTAGSSSTTMPNWWSQLYFGRTGVSQTAVNSDGLTNWQKYQNGFNPNDYYNGQVPVISVASGDSQSTFVQTTASEPLKVLITDSNRNPLVNAPVEFSVNDYGSLSSMPDGYGAVSSVRVSTGQDGTAQVYFTGGQVAETESVTVSAVSPSASVSTVVTTFNSLTVLPPNLTLVSGVGQTTSPLTPAAEPIVVQVTVGASGDATSLVGFPVQFNSEGLSMVSIDGQHWSNDTLTVLTDIHGNAQIYVEGGSAFETTNIMASAGNSGNYIETGFVVGPATPTGVQATYSTGGGTGALTWDDSDAANVDYYVVRSTYIVNEEYGSVVSDDAVYSNSVNLGNYSYGILMQVAAVAHDTNGVQYQSAFSPSVEITPWLEVYSGNSQAVMLNSASPAPLVAQVTWADGTPAVGQAVTFFVPTYAANGIYSSCTVSSDKNNWGTTVSVVSDANGLARAWVAPQEGSNEDYVGANVNGLGPTGVTVYFNLSLAQSQVQPYSGNGQTVQPGAEAAAPLKVQMDSPGGEPVADGTVAFSTNVGLISNDGIHWGTTANATTNSDGIAEIWFTGGSEDAVATVTATGGTTLAFTVWVSQPIVTSLSGGNQTSLPGIAAASPLTAKLTEGTGASIPGAPMEFTVTQGSGWVSGDNGVTWATSVSVNTDFSGLASVQFLDSFPESAVVTASAGGGSAAFAIAVNPPTAFPANTASQSVGGSDFSLALTHKGTVWACGHNSHGQLGNGTYNDSTLLPLQIDGLALIKSIAAGDGFGLALRYDGTVWTWGDNSVGQLGTGSSANSSNVPQQVTALSNVVQISAAGGDAIALDSSGRIWVWGGNSVGQLGNDTTTNSNVPVHLSALDGATRIATGGNNGLAADAMGNLWTWGDNSKGQLGTGSSGSLSSIPVEVPGLSSIQLLAAGPVHALAVDASGTVWAWGDNSYGELGNGLSAGSNTPVQVSGLQNSHPKQISAGLAHSLVLTASPSVMLAWGNNNNGQLGIGDVISSNMPMEVGEFAANKISQMAASSGRSLAVDSSGNVWVWGNASEDGETSLVICPLALPIFSGTENVDLVSAGFDHSLAVRSDGTLWSWGGDEYGQLGNGTTFGATAPAQVCGLTGVTAISAGPYFSLAATGSSLYAWGFNGTGQLGNGTLVDSSSPVEVSGLPSSLISSVAAGAHHALVAVEGDSGPTVYTWGYNGDGELGNGSTTNSSTPVNVSLSAVAVAAGSNHSLALKNDGTVWAWGGNAYGQLGSDPATTSNSVTPIPVAGLSGVAQIAASANFSLALTNSGYVYAWGDNQQGQLGNNTTAESFSPVQVQGLNGAVLSGIVRIVAGENFAYAQDASGTIWSWGAGASGQLGNDASGNGTTAGKIAAFTAPVVGLAAGSGQGFAILTTGIVMAWGDNSVGQLGNGTTLSSWTPTMVSGVGLNVPVTQAPLNLPLTAQVAAGDHHVLALAADGTIWAWGDNQCGQLGANLPDPSYPTPVPVTSLLDVSQVAAGTEFSLALRKDGTVWFWGANLTGWESINGVESLYTLTPTNVSGLSNVTAIAAGSSHALAIVETGGNVSSGTVWAWGNNSSGQLGNGTNSTSSVPTAVSGTGGVLSGVAAVAAGFQHSLALKADGSVWAWGSNGYGQLGNSSNVGSNVPVQVTGLTNIVSIAAGANFSLAVRSDGTVWAWGDNASGELGNGTLIASNAPIQVSGLTGALTVAGGAATAYAVTSDGTVYSWGNDGSGQMGVGGLDGTNMSIGASKLPIEIPPGSIGSIASVSSFAGFAVALATDGSVWTWGLGNVYGELGNALYTYQLSPGQLAGFNLLGYAPVSVQAVGGTILPANSNVTLEAQVSATSPSVSSVSFYVGNQLLATINSAPFVYDWVSAPPGLYTVTARSTTSSGLVWTSAPISVKIMGNGYDSVSGGADYSMALRSDGTLWSWGHNASGQLGDGANETQRDAPVWVRGSNNVIAFGTGVAHSLALTADGNVWAWGDNANGDIGDGTTIQRNAPVQVSGLSGIIGISAGGNDSLALRNDGTVWAWGDNEDGELGLAASGTGSVPTQSSVPVQVSLPSGAVMTAVAMGRSHALALKSDGTVWAWGNNSSGQLGNGSETSGSTPVQVSGLSGIVAISAGDNYSLALGGDGSVYTWGSNSNGQLGNNSTTGSNIPVHLSGSALSGIVAIAANGGQSLALKGDGTLWAWGLNSTGQLGINATANSLTPVQVSAPASATALGAGGVHSLAVSADGTVWAWGANTYGQVGDATVTERDAPVLVSSLTGTIQLAEGSTHTLALHSDGTVWAWGGNASGQLGNNSTTDSLSPVQVEGIIGAVQIVAGANFCLALTSNGRVWAWGDDSYGQMGLGAESTTPQLIPYQVTTLSGMVALSVGQANVLALGGDGTVWAWGDNTYGELGNGTTSQSSIPVQISPGSLSSVAGIASGSYHSVALLTDGNVAAWGDNTYGELGNGSTAQSNVPVLVSGLSAVQLAAGNYHTLALLANQTLKAWGNNQYGQLGDGTTVNRSSPVVVNGVSSVVQVGGGAYYSAALLTSGAVVTWGSDQDGQLGNGTTSTSSSVATVSGLGGPVSVLATGDSASHTMFLQNNGSVWGAGLNANGQLGNGSTSNSSTPINDSPAGSSGPVITLTDPTNAILLPP